MADFQGKVLVLGANGETGQRVVRTLQSHHIPARAMVRTQEKAQELTTQIDEIVVGDLLHPHDLQQALSGITAIISTIGTRTFTDLKAIEEAEYSATHNLIEAAKEAAIQQVVLCSSMGTHAPESIPPLALILRTKQRAEEELIHSGLTYTIVHPGGLTNQPGGQGVLVTPHPAPTNGTISREDVAEVLVQALFQPAARNQSVDIISRPDQGPANRPDLFG